MKNLMKCFVPLLGVFLLSCGTQAAPKGPMGPSAKAAARLKQSPPNNWIRHYLPEDRYKLGAAWKFVTTELDTYYHRPSCPNMLRQTASRVIGFENIREAEEAGYFPDRTCSHGSFQAGAAGGSAPSTGRVTLADGASAVTVPAGWKRLSSRGMEIFGMKMGIDTFSSSKGTRVEIQTGDLSGLQDQSQNSQIASMDFGQMLTVAGMKKLKTQTGQLVSSLNNTSQINSRASSFVNTWSSAVEGLQFREARIGGRRGVLQIQPNGFRGPSRTHLVGKGKKYLGIVDYSRTGNGAAPFLRTLKLGF